MNMPRKSRKWIERDKPLPLDEVLPVTLLLSKPEKKQLPKWLSKFLHLHLAQPEAFINLAHHVQKYISVEVHGENN